jgi:hypothetical protein
MTSKGQFPPALRSAPTGQTTFASPVIQPTAAVPSTVTHTVGIESPSRNDELYLALAVFFATAFVLALFAVYRRSQKKTSGVWQTLSCF